MEKRAFGVADHMQVFLPLLSYKKYKYSIFPDASLRNHIYEPTIVSFCRAGYRTTKSWNFIIVSSTSNLKVDGNNQRLDLVTLEMVEHVELEHHRAVDVEDSAVQAMKSGLDYTRLWSSSRLLACTTSMETARRSNT